MINRKISIIKKLKLKDIHLPGDKNLYRTSFFWNFLKFRKKKWGYQRANFFKSFENLLHRFDPTKIYIPIYDKYFELDFQNENFRIFKFTQFLKYSSLLVLKKKFLGFFYIKKTKTLRDRLVYRNMHSNLKIFDTFLDLMLIRIGGSNHMKQARQYVKTGVFKLNLNTVKAIKFMNNLDYVQFSKKPRKLEYKSNFYDKKDKGYKSTYFEYIAPFFYKILMSIHYFFKINSKRIFLEICYISLIFYTFFNYFIAIMYMCLEKLLKLKKDKNFIPKLVTISKFFCNNFFSINTRSRLKKGNSYFSGNHFNFYNKLLYNVKNTFNFQKFLNFNVEPNKFRTFLSKVYTFFPNISNLDENYSLCYGVKDFCSDILPFPFTINYSTFDFIYFDFFFKNQWHFNVNWYTLRKFLRYNRG
jgi:hypothetical protein